MFDFEEGDIIKLAIVSTQFNIYPEFKDNDGTYIVRFNPEISGMDLFALGYEEDGVGHISQHIEFDGKHKFPTMHDGLIKGDTYSWPDYNMKELFIKNLSHTVYKQKEKDTKSLTYFLLSKFKYNGCEYEFYLQCPRSTNRHTQATIKPYIQHLIKNKSLACILYPSDDFSSHDKIFKLEIMTDVFESGTKVNRELFIQDINDYFQAHDVKEYSKTEIAVQLKNANDYDSINEVLTKYQDQYNLRRSPIRAIRKYVSEKQKDPVTQFDMENSHAYLENVS
tara:strand:+ start:12270 stop:13109 length:840 start_codon:yes stop_codon:yes gene_type:complete